MRRVLLPAAAPLAALLFAGSFAAPSSASTIVGWWHMDEGAGATRMVDSSPYGNHGSVYSVRTGVDGLGGRAYDFDDRPSVVTVPDSSTLDPGSRRLAISVYVRMSTPVGDWNVLEKGRWSTAGGQYKIEIQRRDSGRRGVAQCRLSGSRTATLLQGGPNLADGRWHRIICRKNDTHVSLQVDAAVVAQRAVTIGSISNSAPLTIGAKNRRGGDQYIGYVDGPIVYVG